MARQKWARAIGAAALAASMPWPCTAQSDSISTSAALPTEKCELHVWPAANVNSMFYGWSHGSTVNGAAKRRRGYPAIPNDPLPPAKQIERLQALPLEQLLGRPVGEVVFHSEPLDRALARAPGKHSASAARCYGELIVSDIFYEDAAFSERSLRTLFDYRAYDGEEGAAPSRFMTWTEVPLSIFPPKTDADMQSALAEIGAAFSGDFRYFAQARITARAKSAEAARRTKN